MPSGVAHDVGRLLTAHTKQSREGATMGAHVGMQLTMHESRN